MSTDVKQLLNERWEPQETQTIFQCAGCGVQNSVCRLFKVNWKRFGYSNDKMLYQPITAVARQIESKVCVCATLLSYRIDQFLSNCCSHNLSPFESSNNIEMCVWICVMFMWLWRVFCVVVVIVFVVLLLSWSWPVLWLSCVCCGWCVSIVVCTCEWFAFEHNDSVAFYPLTIVDVKTRTIFEFFFFLKKICAELKIIILNYHMSQKRTSVRYRNISN